MSKHRDPEVAFALAPRNHWHARQLLREFPDLRPVPRHCSHAGAFCACDQAAVNP